MIKDTNENDTPVMTGVTYMSYSSTWSKTDKPLTNYFMPVSTQYIAVAVIILTQVASAAGVEVSSEKITELIVLSLTLLPGLWILIERFKKGGINWFGMKK